MKYSIADLPADAPTSLATGITLAAQKILDGARDPEIITLTRRVIQRAGLPRDATPDEIVAALQADQETRIAFVLDPDGDELMIGASTLFCVNPDGSCVPGGDCDDQIIAALARLRSVGIGVRLVVCLPAAPDPLHPELGTSRQAHIRGEYDSTWSHSGKWRCYDPSLPGGACEISGYSELIPFELSELVPDNGKIMSMGIPRTLGDPVAAPTESLPPDQQAAWVGVMTSAVADLDRARTRLRDWTTRYPAIRAALGMPPTDPSPSPPSAAPLLDYINAVGPVGAPAPSVWTSDAATQQAKMLQAADFMSQVAHDGLSGARQMYWHDGDLFVEAKPGDPYGVLLEQNAAGQTVPAVIDLTTHQPSGTFGNPILIGIAIVAISVGAIYAVVKICDYLSQAHRDDAMSTIAAAQQKLIESGKATPEQAAAFIQAAKDLASAPGPSAAGEPAWPWGKLLGFAGLGVAVGVLAATLLGRLFGGSSPVIRLAPASA